MKVYRRLSAVLTAGAVLLCGLAFPAFAEDGRDDDIIILYTNDMHCGIEITSATTGSRSINEKWKLCMKTSCWSMPEMR